MISKLSVSVVVPVYSGERYLRRLFDELVLLRKEWSDSYEALILDEVIFVDDAAIDRSASIIDELSREYEWVMPLHLSRNYGQHAATIAGILHTSGDWVVTMDEDLQHRPARILDLLRQASETSADIVYANPKNSVHEAAWRDLTSRLAKRVVEVSAGTPDIRKVSSFRLIRGTVARAASSICGPDTYFDIALSWFTRRVEMVEMALKDDRFIQAGKSGYRLRSLLSHGRRLLFSTHLKVLRLGALFGLSVAIGSMLAGCAMLLYKLAVPGAFDVRGWTSLILTITFFGGTIIFLIGILLEYLSILVLRAHGKPLFFVVDRSSDAILKDAFE
jgi:glycosyltransferase involved in cell wall biosynthesis